MQTQDLVTRVERLEKENRSLKRAGLGLVVVVLLGLVVGAKSGPGKIAEFDKLTVKELKVMSAPDAWTVTLRSLKDQALIGFFKDSEGDVLNSGIGSLSGGDDGLRLEYANKKEKQTLALRAGNSTGALLEMVDGKGPDSGRVIISPQEVRLSRWGGDAWAVLGATQTVHKRTGATTHTQPNTLTLFDEDGTVLFQAP